MPRPDHTGRNAVIAELYVSGRSTAYIAALYEMTHERVRQILVKAGVPRRGKGHRSAQPAHEGHDNPATTAAGNEQVAAHAPDSGDHLS